MKFVRHSRFEDYILTDNEHEKGNPLMQPPHPHKYLNYVIAGCIIASGVVALMLYKILAWIF